MNINNKQSSVNHTKNLHDKISTLVQAELVILKYLKESIERDKISYVRLRQSIIDINTATQELTCAIKELSFGKPNSIIANEKLKSEEEIISSVRDYYVI